ncbi:MAG: MarR family transcriptional regulator [Anaerolineales bacterium]|nr:MarR family transcriptional regulator [Anaerolineales bacterium]
MTKSPPVRQSLRAWMEISTHRSMHEWSRFAKSTGLSMPQFSILMQLHHKGMCGVSEISERFGITNAASSQLVEKLVHAGYLDRAEDPNDRRAKQLHLSKKGEKFVKDGIEKHYGWTDEMLKNFNITQQKKIDEVLIMLTEAAQKMESKK